MAEKRKRSQNFVAEEKYKLLKLLCAYKDTILNKKTDGSTNEAKNKSWTELTNSFNTSATVHRTKESLIKIWDKLKCESKVYSQNFSRNTFESGGHPSEIIIDPIMEQVCALLGRACTGTVGVQDCDSNIPFVDLEEDTPPPKRRCYDEGSEDEALYYIVEAALSETKSDINADNVEDHQTKQENYISRKRPKYSQTNGKTDAISSFCSTCSIGNKKNEHIEELKTQLLIDEVNFKKKIHELQLEAARKEVEIKTEILNKIKDGSLNMQQHLFGIPKDNN